MKALRHLLAGLACVTALRAADPVAPPPAVTEFRNPAPRPDGPTPAGAAVQYSIGNPTDEEQFYLELLNRARAHPAAEGVRLATTANLDSDTLAAYQFFNVDLVKMQSDLAAFPPLPPLALEPRLTQAARGHTQWMLANGIQSHEETSPAGSQNVVNTTGTRITSTGYSFSTAGESVFAFAASVPNGHAGFEVDWGNGPGGVQDPPGHRLNNHSANFREIGIGVLDARNSVTNIIGGVTNIGNVGPQLVTFDFGARFSSQPLLTGVAYYDLNGNQAYDPGEGIGGLNVTVAGNDNFAVTANSGGYAVPTANGPQVVTFSGPNFPGFSQSVTVANGDNLKLDLPLTYVPPMIGGTRLANVSGSTPYAAQPIPGATAYQWEYARRTLFSAVLGAEAGAGDFTATVGPGYSVVSTDSHRTGSASYHLAHTNSTDQVLTLNARLRTTASAQMSFATRLAAATTNEFARAQISTNSGASWITVWEQNGRTNNSGGTIENSFTLRTIPLTAFADQEISVRFTYVVVRGVQTVFFNQTGSLYGFFFDDLGFTGVEQLTQVTASTTASPSFAFVPPGAGDYALHASPQVGGRFLTAGPWFFLSTTNGTPPSVTLSLATNGPGSVSALPPGGIYSPGTVVSLTANPMFSMAFTGWSGGATGNANPLALTLNASTTVTANFIANHSLATAAVGQGTVTANPTKAGYADGEVVSLTATPVPGWAFVNWTGDLTGSVNPGNLVMNGNKSVTAVFTPTFTLTTSVTGQGSVAALALTNVFLANSVAQVFALPAPGWVFAGWSGDLSGTVTPANLLMDANKSITANFIQPLPPGLDIGAIVLGPSGNLRVDFTVTGGNPTVLTLLKASDPAGPYLPLAATLATNSPGHYSFKQIAPSGGAGFLRVEAQ